MAKNAKTNPNTLHNYVNSKTWVETGNGELKVVDVTSISDDENQESGIRNILLSPMASNIKYTVYSIHVTNEKN